MFTAIGRVHAKSSKKKIVKQYSDDGYLIMYNPDGVNILTDHAKPEHVADNVRHNLPAEQVMPNSVRPTEHDIQNHQTDNRFQNTTDNVLQHNSMDHGIPHYATNHRRGNNETNCVVRNNGSDHVIRTKVTSGYLPMKGVLDQANATDTSAIKTTTM